MAEKELDVLIKRMGDIAKAVNAFSSDAVQQTAFAALVDAFNETSEGKSNVANDDEAVVEESRTKKKATASKPAASASGTGKVKVNAEVDLRPKDKQSFADFIVEKKPSSNQDKFAVVVFYLEQILELPAITLQHISFVFRVTSGWREPADLGVAVRVAASRKGTIDVSNANDNPARAQLCAARFAGKR